MDSNTVHEMFCEVCQTANYYYEPSSQYGYEPYGIECHKCGHRWPLYDDPDIEQEDDYELGLEEAF